MQCQNINSKFRNAHSYMYKDFYVMVPTSKKTKCVKIINFDMQKAVWFPQTEKIASK